MAPGVEEELRHVCPIRDSKQLSAQRREDCYARLIEHPGVRHCVGIVENERIDQINILQATFEAMTQAADGVLALVPHSTEVKASRSSRWRVLIDGPYVPPELKMRRGLECEGIVKGDSLHFLISAASIIAKVKRDQIMQQHAAVYPLYSFERHKGYATAAHRAALKEHGPCKIHRQSFKGVLREQ